MANKVFLVCGFIRALRGKRIRYSCLASHFTPERYTKSRLKKNVAENKFEFFTVYGRPSQRFVGYLLPGLLKYGVFIDFFFQFTVKRFIALKTELMFVIGIKFYMIRAISNV